MSSANFNLRSIPPEVMRKLKMDAKKYGISMNMLILKLIENGIGYSHELKKPIYHDLDKLAGTWSAKEADAFAKNIKDFEKIDEDLWK
jgi:hypothetical protein